jgi:hypothetical protein
LEVGVADLSWIGDRGCADFTGTVGAGSLRFPMPSLGNFSMWVQLDQSMVVAFLRSLGTNDAQLARAGYLNERAGFLMTSRFALVGLVLSTIALLFLCGAAAFFGNSARTIGRPSSSGPGLEVAGVMSMVGLVFLYQFVIYAACFAFCYWLWRRSAENVAMLDRCYFAITELRATGGL